MTKKQIKCGMRMRSPEEAHESYASYFDVVATGPKHITLVRKDGALMTFSRKRVEKWLSDGHWVVRS